MDGLVTRNGHMPLVRRYLLRPYSWFLPAILWAVVIGLSYAWNINTINTFSFEMATSRGKMVVEVVQSIRSWNAKHGGVYAPITAETQPNPYLETSEKIITTPKGVPLTKLNPAYMTRQLAELMKEGDVHINMTSDRPINPDNAPDEWESKGLTAFQSGAGEYIGLVGERFRYMAPLPVEQACLGCHQTQGYEVGDVRGGLSVSFPKDAIESLIAQRRQVNLFAHLLGYALLLMISFISMRAVRRVVVDLEAEKQSRDIVIAERTQALSSEVAVRKKSEAMLREMATHDELTGLHNRRYYMEMIRRELERARRYDRPFSIILLDLDYFKIVNDTWGHTIGDMVLKAFAQTVKQSLRSGDIFARTGGEEFSVLLPETKIADAHLLAERIRVVVEMMELDLNPEIENVRVTVSAGVACSESHEFEMVEDLIGHADIALYKAKRRGRNQVCIYEETMPD